MPNGKGARKSRRRGVLCHPRDGGCPQAAEEGQTGKGFGPLPVGFRERRYESNRDHSVY